MSFTRQTRVPQAPTLPKGEPVASYGTYLEAQRAVDHLADKQFPVQNVTIVGTDLRMVERVTGRLSYPRVALAGLATGMWFGLFVGLLLWMFSAGSGSTPPLLAAILIGAAFGVLFSVITYAFTGGKRDFTSSSQIVAAQYAVLCAAEHAHRARALLQEIGGVQSGWPARTAPATLPPSDPSGSYPTPPGAQPPSASPTVPPVGPTTPPAPPQQPPAG
ncbi:general stress protein [Cellulomonas sp. P22]|uniref:general stress protein n=1 Tax=Cellulomonas sp. P22 TaxID=3373189 RepID=UPI0037B0970A